MLDDARWSVSEAKAKLSEILRRARAGAPQMIGGDEPCFVVSAGQFEQMIANLRRRRALIASESRSTSRAPGDGRFA
jgi:antitoxin (DNA-binding transcriptional repressor) of toxin-antitoxin stability system